MAGMVMGDDGLLARKNGAYAEEKLDFFERFCPPALKVTKRKFQRVFIDLFAGPGRNVDGATGRNFESAAIRVLKTSAPNDPRLAFTHARLINLRRADGVQLEKRVTELHRRRLLRVPDVEFLRGDGNELGPAVLRSMQESFGRGAYVLAFADPECPSQLPWSTLAAIGRGAPESTDLYVLMPLDMAINRMLPYQEDRIEPNAEALTTYFGTEAWRPIVAEYPTSAQRAQLRSELLGLYKHQLRRHWRFVEEVRAVNRSGDQRLYRMLFCTRNASALSLANWERSSVVRNDQLGLGLESA